MWISMKHAGGSSSRCSNTIIVFAVVVVGQFREAAACNAQGYSARDSAGISVVTSSPRPQGTGSTWTVSPDPILQIGEVEGEQPYLFRLLWDGFRLPDGRLVVVDGQALEIRVFDADGRHETTFGGRGNGPREFGGPPWIALAAADTIVTWDPGHHRLSRYDPAGNLLDQESLMNVLADLSIAPFPNARIWQTAAEGALLWTGSPPMLPQEGLRDVARHVVLIDGTDGTSVDFGSYPAGQMLWFTRGNGQLTGLPDPFAPFSAIALGPEPVRVSIADGESWEIRSFDGHGALRRILRATIPPRPVTRQVRARERERLPEQARILGLPLAEAQRAFNGLPVPQALPPIASMRWDAQGNLWVGRREGGYLEVPEEYDIFDAEGHWLAGARIPSSLGRILEIGADYVLAAWTDEMGVEYVRLYALDKASR